MATNPHRPPHRYASNFSRLLGSPRVPVQAMSSEERMRKGSEVIANRCVLYKFHSDPAVRIIYLVG